MNDENVKVLYEGNVSLEGNKLNILLIIDNNKLLFQKKKGLLKKKYIIVKEILLSDINVNKGKMGIKTNGEKLSIITNKGVVRIFCGTEEEANKISSILTGAINVPLKKNKFKKIAKGAIHLAGAAITSGALVDAVKAVKKKDVKSVAKAVSKFADKL